MSTITKRGFVEYVNPEEARLWQSEIDALDFVPPNPNFNRHTVEGTGWGIPPFRLPPEDAFRYVWAMFRENLRDRNGQPLRIHDKNHPDYVPLNPVGNATLLIPILAHFAWFKSRPGAAWLLDFFGVQEVAPFYSGYHYFLRENGDDVFEFTRDKGELRVFRDWQRDDTLPVDAPKIDGMSGFDQMVKLLDQFRDPRAPAPCSRSIEFWRPISKAITNWLGNGAVADWPVKGVTLMTGEQWVMTDQREDGSLFYEGLARVLDRRERARRGQAATFVRAYKWTEPDGRSLWFDDEKVQPRAKTDQLRSGSMNVSMDETTEASIQKTFRCRTCRKVRPCTPQTEAEHLCCHCYSIQVERGRDMPSLNFCTMLPECSACPDRIGSRIDLERTKNRIRQGR